jgi:hypothetical protein
VGRITVSRLAYRAAGVGNLHPADEVLGLPAGLYSPGLGCLCAREAVRGSFVQAADAVERASGVRIGTRQVIGLVRDAAVDAAAFHADRAVPPVPDGDVLVLTGDGKGVPVLPAALRPDAAKAAAKAPPGRGPRKRMAELVAVYTVHPAPRTVDDVVPPADHSAGRCEEQPQEQPVEQAKVKGPAAADTWLTASLIEDIPRSWPPGSTRPNAAIPATSTRGSRWLTLCDLSRCPTRWLSRVPGPARGPGVSWRSGVMSPVGWLGVVPGSVQTRCVVAQGRPGQAGSDAVVPGVDRVGDLSTERSRRSAPVTPPLAVPAPARRGTGIVEWGRRARDSWQ